MTTNFSKLALLNNTPIVIKIDTGETFIFSMPTLQDEVSGILNYDFFYGFCVAELTDLQKKINIEFSSKKDFLIKAIKSGDMNIISLLGCLSKHIQDFKYVDDSFYCGEFELTDEIFEIFCLYIAVASGCLKWSAFENHIHDAELSPEEREWERRKRENQAKINAAKEKAGKGINMEDIVCSLVYEYGLSLKELYNLNKFGIMTLYDNVMSITSYQVGQIAAGTGNLGKNSKFTYWTNK